MATAPRSRLAAAAPYAAHTLTVLALFWPLLLQGRMLFFRDILVTYYPDLVFLEQSLERGVWPLWHQAADG